MSLLYFEKRTKYGLLDPNGPLSSCVPLETSVGQTRGIRGLTEYLLSRDRQHPKERNLAIGPYDSQIAIANACNSSCD